MWWLGLSCIAFVTLAMVIGSQVVIPNNELVFVNFRDQGYVVIYRMDIAHHLIQPITDERQKVFVTDANWSPDGQQIVFVRASTAFQTALYVMDAQGHDARRLLPNAPVSDFSPTWSPDGQQIAFIRRFDYSPELMVVDLPSGITRQLSNNVNNENNPTWSPDGRSLTYAANASEIKTIYNLDLHTAERRIVFNSSVDVDDPAWSPDGRYLAYVESGRNAGIYLWDGIQSMVIHSAVFIPTDAPDWSADGRYLVYAAAVGLSGTAIFKLDVNSCLKAPDLCQPQRLTTVPGFYQSPHWRPNPP